MQKGVRKRRENHGAMNRDTSPARALIVAPAWIGDAVMAQPLFIRLRQRFPDIRLDALAPRWVAPVLQRMPEISTTIDNPFAHGELSLAARYRLARELAQQNYQRAYILPNSLKSVLIPFLAGIPERIGFTGEARYGLLNRRHTLDETALPQMAERFAQLAEAPGAALPRPLPPLHLASSTAQRAETFAALHVINTEKIAVSDRSGVKKIIPPAPNNRNVFSAGRGLFNIPLKWFHIVMVQLLHLLARAKHRVYSVQNLGKLFFGKTYA